MLRSRANTLLSVRRVTERNAGRLTAGVDGEVVLTPEAKASWPTGSSTSRAVQGPAGQAGVHPQAGSRKRRPLGIPVIVDRVHQARVVNALEPEWEARFEPRSYGFRPGRGCHDAIQAIHRPPRARARGGCGCWTRIWHRAFDRIAHDHILNHARRVPRQGNDPGMAEGGRGRARSAASHRGGSSARRCGQPAAVERRPARDGDGRRGPLLQTGTNAGKAAMGSPVLIRYADDLVASATPGRRRSRSRHGSPAGWRPGVWRSTRTRRASSPSMRASTSWDSTSAATAASC